MISATEDFIADVLRVAAQHGFTIEDSRNGKQIDFGHKKLHEGHLRRLYPDITVPGAHIPTLIEGVAPGRSCSHLPMRKIIESLRQNGKL